MTEIRLQKVKKRLYHETNSHEGRPLKWEKRFLHLYLELGEFEVEFGLSVYNSDKFKETSEETEIEDEFSEQLGWHISGIGHNHRVIGVIKRNGTIESIRKLKVSIAYASDSEKKKPGYLFYYGREELKYGSENEPYLLLYVKTSADSLEKMCREILSNGLSKLRIDVEVDAFQSEMVGAFGPPMDNDVLCIEEEGDPFKDNIVYLSSIRASRSVDGAVPDATDETNQSD